MTDTVLFCYMGACVFTDLRFRKVYNAATLAAVILGFGANYIYFGFAGLKISLLGLTAGFLFSDTVLRHGRHRSWRRKVHGGDRVPERRGFCAVRRALRGCEAGAAGIVVLIIRKGFKTIKEIFSRALPAFNFQDARSREFGSETRRICRTRFSCHWGLL